MARVFVSGCYDMLHSGHVAFFCEASQYGDLYVGIGSDATIKELKGRTPIYSEQERLYMVKAIRYVTDACINRGSGMMDFVESVEIFKPDVFVVNEDGSSPVKEQFCRERGIGYVVLKREPEKGLKARSTTALRTVESQLPTRMDIAGTWIDQPFVSKVAPGWAITISLEPTFVIQDRSGMATSTRNAIRRIWPYNLPAYDPERLAKLVFCFENEPERQKHVSGAQDSIGICMPGLVRHYYDGAYWPEKIESCHDEAVLSWMEGPLCMIFMFSRPIGTSVTRNTRVTPANVTALTSASACCWEAILKRDLYGFARYFGDSFAAQTAMFPGMLSNNVSEYIEKYCSEVLALKLSGAGGGGYLQLVVEDSEKFCQEHPEAIPIKIRRRE